MDTFNSMDFQRVRTFGCLNQDWQDYRIHRIVKAILSSESGLSQMTWITRIVASVKLRRNKCFQSIQRKMKKIGVGKTATNQGELCF